MHTGDGAATTLVFQHVSNLYNPTGDVDSHNLEFSWAASAGAAIRSADVTNAFLHCLPMDRVPLYRTPRGGIPEEGIEEGSVTAARVPIYGARDAGCNFWLRLKAVCISLGLVLNPILPTLIPGVDEATLARLL